MITFHCIIHVEVLCAKFGLEDIQDIIKSVILIINYLKSHALVHRQFRDFLSNIDSDYEDVLHYTDVRWLSCGKMAMRFYKLLPAIGQFFLEQNITQFPQINVTEWLMKFSFLCDVTTHLNELNMHLQGKSILFYETVSRITAFNRKLGLFREQLLKSDFTHFPLLATAKVPDNFNLDYFIGIIDSLINQFNKRFDAEQFQVYQLCGDFLCNPQNFQINNIEKIGAAFNSNNLKQLQSELIDLQSDNLLPNNIIEKWKTIRYPELRILASKIFACFSSTFCCEACFSSLEMIKSKLRSSLTDESLEASLICAVSNIPPRFDSIILKLDCRSSTSND